MLSASPYTHIVCQEKHCNIPTLLYNTVPMVPHFGVRKRNTMLEFVTKQAVKLHGFE